MKIVFRGPGDSVNVDGIDIKKGEAVEVTADQYARLAAVPGAVVEVSEGKADDSSIRKSQEEQREKAVVARERETKRAEKSAAKEGE